MTAAVFRNTPSLSVPQTQNTAPVLEFNCLYTHDVRKKAKKWQDGVVRYHTFNKRCMVYDVPRNFIGDMHWTGDEDVQEGDELTLERCGVKVEVADCIGRTETDLSELRKSKDKNQSTAETLPSRTAPPPIARSITAVPAKANTQLKHRSLNALLGTPKGPIGKAQLPTRSPFETRHANEENEAWEDGRPAKRPKTGETWNVTRTTTTPKAAKAKEPPLWARTSDAAKQKKKPALQAGQQELDTREIIALSDDDNGDEQPANDFLPGFSDDVLPQSSSPAKANQKTATSATARSSSPAFQTQQNLPGRTNRRVEIPKPVRRRETVEEAPDEDEDCVVTNVTSTKKPNTARVDKRPTEGTSVPDPPKSAPAERQKPNGSKTGQMLRLTATAPKKKGLLCQNQLSKASSKKSPPSAIHATSEIPKDCTPKAPSPEQNDRALKAREQLEARLARIDKKGGSTSSARLKQASKKRASMEEPTIENGSKSVRTGDVDTGHAQYDAGNAMLTSHEQSALELRRLDDRMLPPSGRRPQTVRAGAAATASPPPQPTRKEDRPLRRTISESNAVPLTKPKRVPGAPVRYTPSPTKRSRESTPAAASRPATPTPVPNEPVTHVPTTKTFRPRKPLQKSVSLNVTSNGTSAVVLGRKFKAPSAKSDFAKEPEPEVAMDFGPWSRDAFDLFTWRPPGWDEEQWCVKEDGEKSAPPPIGLSGGVSLPAV